MYSQEEFFADTTPHAEHLDAASPRSTERQLHRLAGATVLLVTVGVVGSMIVVSTVSLPAGRRRSGARALAASGSLPPAGARVAQAGLRRRSPAKPPHRVKPQAAVTQIVSVQGPAQVVLEANAGAPVSVAELTTRTSAASPQPVQIEFGFER